MKYAVPEYIQIHNRCCCSTFWDPIGCSMPGFPVLHYLLEFAQAMGREDTTERLHFHFSLSCTGEGNGNPLQCSCLENPRDGEPGGLPSMGSHRVGHDWSDLAAAAAAMPNTDQERLKFNCNGSPKRQVFILIPHNSENRLRVNIFWFF